MDDIGFDFGAAVAWFRHDQEMPYVLIKVSEAHANSWAQQIGVALRRCYVTDAVLDARSAALGRTKREILDARLPDAGSTMSGDFGEILAYLYHAAREHPRAAIGPKKWRLKQDRTKPAPYSDVVHFVLPSWPQSSSQDELLCSEVKAKATAGASTPIASAIKDSAKDRTSRLAGTLVWLRDRALVEDLGDVNLAHLDRFINATSHPPATKRFRAVAVVCSSFLQTELAAAPPSMPTGYTVVVIAVPGLKAVYTSVFAAARRSVAPVPPGGSGGVGS